MNRREVKKQIAFKIWTAVLRLEKYKIGSGVQILETICFILFRNDSFTRGQSNMRRFIYERSATNIRDWSWYNVVFHSIRIFLRSIGVQIGYGGFCKIIPSFWSYHTKKIFVIPREQGKFCPYGKCHFLVAIEIISRHEKNTSMTIHPSSLNDPLNAILSWNWMESMEVHPPRSRLEISLPSFFKP